MEFRSLICLISCFVIKCSSDNTYILYHQFNNSFDGILAGFADYNADKNVDIFAIANSGQNVDVWLVNKDGEFHHKTVITNPENNSKSTSDYISGIMLADFNGDGYQDVLCNKKSSDASISVQVYWGSKDGFNHSFELPGLFKDEPVLFDYNSDMLVDIMTIDQLNNSATVWMPKLNTYKFNQIDFKTKFELQVPHSSAFVQLKSFFNTDLLLTTTSNSFTLFMDGDYTEPTVYNINNNLPVGQSAFADFNQDGTIEHLVSTGNQIQVHHNNTWHILIDLPTDYTFDYDHSVTSQHQVTYKLPVNLIIGDYDQDGYPDILVVAKKNTKYIPILLKNVPCNINNKCVGFGRMLLIEQNVLPNIEDNVHVAAFFDYMEDGTLDILLTCSSSSSSSATLHTILLSNNIASDTCFMKVTVTNGVVDSYPSNDKKPYGVNTPGPSVRYETIKPGGEVQRSCATQMSQSSHFSLQLPFILFGLGQTPNFVDEVTITLPQIFNKTTRQKQWTQIIPNSQLLVNPNKPDTPLLWTMQLFVMPSKAIYTTAAVLGATCIGLIFIVAGLLVVEKKEDKAERNQESQRFHFDAM